MSALITAFAPTGTAFVGTGIMFPPNNSENASKSTSTGVSIPKNSTLAGGVVLWLCVLGSRNTLAASAVTDVSVRNPFETHNFFRRCATGSQSSTGTASDKAQ